MKGKDPAFLFYTKEFYEGTRTMLPIERACYVDLMIYQHQHGGIIPNEIDRISMYCSGCSKDIVSAVLTTKFQQCPEGWYNEALKKVIIEREEYSDKQSENGRLSQYYGKVKRLFSEKDFRKFETIFKKLSRELQIQIIDNKDFEPHENTDSTTFITSFQHLSDSIAISDSIKDSLGKDSLKGKPKSNFIEPIIEEVREYFLELMMPKIEADKFHNFYASKHWMVGKTKMKDWKAAARGWALRNVTDSKSQYSKSKQQEAQNSTVFQESTKAFREKETITGFKTVTQ